MNLLAPIQIAVRVQEIFILLGSVGLLGFVSRLGIAITKKGIQLQKVSLSQDSIDSLGPTLRQLFITLGPTFIKLGQLLASQPSRVGAKVSEALIPLFEKTPEVPFSQIKKIIIKQIGKKKYKEAFLTIEKKALASASLSQTHRGALANGEEVIVKVQKPGVASAVKTDLMILKGLALAASKIYPSLFPYALFEEFEQATLRELDYLEEAKNIDKFQRNYFKLFRKGDVVFPGYIKELTTKQMIVLEPMKGRKLLDLKPGTTVAREAAALGLASVLEQIFDHGFFHADPHAGNLFYLEEKGQIGFIDLGLVGALEPADRVKFLKIFLAFLKRDRKALTKSLFDLATPGSKTNYSKFEKEIGDLISTYQARGIQALPLDEVFQSLMKLSTDNDLHIPQRYLLMVRSCIMMEGVAKKLDPNISLVSVAVPVLTKSLVNRVTPVGIIKSLIRRR